MIRINFFPLMMIACIFLGPMYSYSGSDPFDGQQQITHVVAGDQFLKEAVDCLLNMRLPIGEACAATETINGSTMPATVISWAAILALAAIVLGVFWFLPLIGRLTSIATILAGVGGLSGMGLFMLAMLGTSAGLAAVQWGAYLTAAVSLLTVVYGVLAVTHGLSGLWQRKAT